MKVNRRPIEVFSMSFLDVISCGFGAIILLLVLSLALEPATIMKIAEDFSEQIQRIKTEQEQLVVKSQDLQKKLKEKQKTLERVQHDLKVLNAEWDKIQNEDDSSLAKVEDQSHFKEKLQTVLQKLSVEMKQLLNEPKFNIPNKDAVIGGIPVDSEYIVFIIDTSGSMLKAAWPLVIKKVEEVLEVYPNVKGMQVINDMGHYMFSAYAGKWIPDTPSRRKKVIQKLRNWRSYSNSNPVEGIKHAVRVFFRKGERISLYVFGDDFSSGSIDTVLREVDRINKKNISGKSRVRIHAFGFPVLFGISKAKENRIRFSHLMRKLSEQNSGSFVGLTVLR